MNELLESIKNRCQERQIQFKQATFKIDDFLPDKNSEPKSIEGLVVQIPVERDHKNIIFLDDDELEFAFNTQFEKYRFIKGFEAIWSQELATIECEIESENSLRPTSPVLQRLGRLLSDVKAKEETTSYQLPSPHPSVAISIGVASNEFTIMSRFKREIFFGRINRFSKRITLKMSGLAIHTHNEALESLLTLGGSILFQIDLATNLPVQFVIDRDLTLELKSGRRKLLAKGSPLGPPRYQYDKEALSLYWYARTAQNMPLLQFLAYYQILEFYFPTYSQAEAHHRIKNLLKNPTFDPNNDTDIVHILNTIKLSAKGRSFGDERSQLSATIHNCVDNDSLWEFFNSNQERKDFFDIRKKSNSLAKQKVSFASLEADLRSDISIRIYELRCRIVHTKDEDELELILPFSPEVGHIKYDLELIEMIARKVIIAGSRPLQLSL